MTKRNKLYMSKVKAMKMFGRITEIDLTSFLAASMEMCRSRVVKSHVATTLRELSTNNRQAVA